MSGFKGNQSGDQSYDNYNDTDACDQVVDFSKIYEDDEEEDDCRPPTMENPQHSLSSVNSVVTKHPPDANFSDEVKFFCTEDTPTIKSSASSYWDLREVGRVEPNAGTLMSGVPTGIEPCFPLPHNFSMDTPGTSTDNCIDSNLVIEEIDTFNQTANKEGECIIQETEASFTKSSSPLMFSRSSSVGSLNSFEQHSIVDDRSSVSAFSNLASGMISPSEIPDSPFEVASPFISKGKNTEFIFPGNDKSEDTILVGPTVPNEEFPDEAFGDFEESDLIKVYDDEGDDQSVSNLSALSIQANSTHISISVIQSKNALVSVTQKSSVTVNCSVTDGEAAFMRNSQNLEISDKSDVLEQNCINTIPSHPSDVSQSENVESITKATKKEDKGTSTSEDFNFRDCDYEHTLSSSSGAKTSTPLKKMKTNEKFICEEGYRVNSLFQQYRQEQQLQSSDCSKDNSDDESDDLLAECILNGMPSKDNSVFNNSKPLLNHSFQTSGSPLKDSFDAPNSSFSDIDISDDDDDILNECVRLGMPHKPNSMQIKAGRSSVLEISSCTNVTSNELLISNSPSHQLKILDEILSQERQIKQELDEENLNLVASKSVSNPRNFAKEEEFSAFNLISESDDQLDDIKNDLAKSDDDSDNDESDLLVQEIIQLGMPKNQSRSPKSKKETKLPVIYPPNKELGYRDNCPDGVSDGEDDDDDMLNELIKAGKPNYKPDANRSIYAESRPCLKSQSQRKLTAAEDRQLYLNNSYYGHILPKASENSPTANPDYMRIYRTEDTPLLSPTASISDLSSLSFTEDKSCQESFLNNSRNSDCSSDSEDDELLQQCIRQGMPAAKRVAA